MDKQTDFALSMFVRYQHFRGISVRYLFKGSEAVARHVQPANLGLISGGTNMSHWWHLAVLL